MATRAKDPRAETIRAAWFRYVILLAGLGLVFLVGTLVAWPWPYGLAVEGLILPQYETRLGFHGGRVPVTTGGVSYTIYALVTVEPGGIMARAGVRAGDIPVEYHGGLWAFYSAVQDRESGKQGHFDVLAQADWSDWSKRQRIVLVPEAESAPP